MPAQARSQDPIGLGQIEPGIGSHKPPSPAFAAEPVKLRKVLELGGEEREADLLAA